MGLLGFYLGYHDSNICVVDKGGVKYRKFERLSGVKHQRVDLQAVIDTCNEWNFSPDYVAYSDGNRNGLGACLSDEFFREVRNLKGLGNSHKSFCVDHHFAHILSAWPCLSSEMLTLGVALDGRGDNGLRTRVIRFGSGLNVESLFQSTEFTIGRFFTVVGQRIGLEGMEIDLAGKVMGAQAYGTPDLDFVNKYVDSDFQTLPRRLLNDIPWRGVIPTHGVGFFCRDEPSFLDWLATCHLLLSQVLERFFSRFCSDDQVIIYSGGCAQNTIFNRVLTQRFPKLVIPPHAYDGGLSLGCVEFLRRYLGLPPQPMRTFPFAQDDEWSLPPSSATVERVASLLADGAVVGWMVGHGEIGPRALGHRSILFDPRPPRAKEVLNCRVKFREAWRPYGASVLAERAKNWFDLGRPSPYMLEAVPVRPDRRGRIPGVTHNDGTCRIQTVAATEQLVSFHQLLTCFDSLTGVPVLLNTSLNSVGEPIYGSATQARRLLASGRLDALCVGDDVILRS